MTTTATPAVGSRPKILVVDDDTNLLAGIVRSHRKEYELITASSPASAIDMLQHGGPFAVIVSDYTMPGMNGATLLHKMQELAPDTVRIMMTGNSDLQSAINAVNQGAVFRFIRKPCEPEVFAAGLNVAVNQHRLLKAEQELLEQTLHGSIQVLIDVLSLVNPEAFGRSRRIRGYMAQLVGLASLTPRWQFETAAMLSQLGCVTVPVEVLAKSRSRQPLTPTEQSIVAGHPVCARELLQHIPRLEDVACAIARLSPTGPTEGADAIAQALRLVVDFEDLVHGGVNRVDAVKTMRERTGVYAPPLLAALDGIKVVDADLEVLQMKVTQLRVGMTFAEDLRNEQGLLVVPNGQQVTATMLVRLRNYSDLGTIPAVCRVRATSA